MKPSASVLFALFAVFGTVIYLVHLVAVPAPRSAPEVNTVDLQGAVELQGASGRAPGASDAAGIPRFAMRPPIFDLGQGGASHGNAGQAGAAAATVVANITYHNGPVMTNGVNVYLIWYGNWTSNTATTIIPDFFNTLGGSPYWNINTGYYSGTTTKTYVKSTVTLMNQSSVAYPYGTALSDAQILQIVKNYVGTSAPDPNALYFVLTSADVTATSGFCTSYCGWHTHATVNGVDMKYSFVGNAARCIASCAAQSTGPNGNAGADGMISVLAHELEETATDPDLNAWYDSAGAENGDKCAWTFGTVSTAPNGAKYNVALGARKFLIQQNWKITQACGMS